MDNLSMETVTYQYDSLNRLVSASAGAQSWGDTYAFDGFGNLTSKVSQGGAPALSQTVDPATNHIVGQSYDSNGNQTSTGVVGVSVAYDAENRLASVPSAGVQYAYDSKNKRIWSSTLSGGNLTQTFYYHGIDGQKLGIYPMTLAFLNGTTPEMTDNTNVKLSTFFGSKRLGAYDRLGTAKYNANGLPQSFYPYGEDRVTQPNDSLKFATYTRDSATGLDYADQRYYASNFGRFMSADPYANSAGERDPGSWNRYAYVRGDPANLFDPRGNEGEDPTYCDSHPSDPNCSGIFVCPDGTQILIGGVCPTPTGQPSNRRKPGQSAGFQNCDSPNGPYQTTDVEFVKDYWKDAVEISQLTGLPAGFILAWASLESYNAAANGLGPAATDNNNFFGLTYRSDSVAAETEWNNSIVCPPGSYDGVSGPGGHSCFAPSDAFLVSGLSALLSFGDKYLKAADAYLDQSGDPTLAGLGQAIAAAGYNPGNPASYGAAIAARFKRLSQYLNCASQ